MRLRPVTLKEARRFVARHHRHNGPGVSWRFGVGLEKDGELIGVAMAGNPKARGLMDMTRVLEINRTCTDGTRHANSKLYGAIIRAAKALGYETIYTYTLPSESGSSLRAVGFRVDGQTEAGRNWEEERQNGVPSLDLFGEAHYSDEPKIRWRLDLGSAT